jgi:hypothetical protein
MDKFEIRSPFNDEPIVIELYEWRITKVTPYAGSSVVEYSYLPRKFQQLKTKRKYPDVHYSTAIRWLLGEDWHG